MPSTTKTKKERLTIYQVLPRLYGNTNTANIPNGTLAENGVGKLSDFTPTRLRRIKQMGFTHIWYTGLIEHATQTHYPNIAEDNPDVVKGKAGSPYAIKDYYDIDPDLADNLSERMAEFEDLVLHTHKAGLKMIMDFVPNHVSRQYHSDAKPDGVRDLGEDDDTSKAFDPQNNFYYIPDEPLHLDNLSTASGTYAESPAKVSGNDVFSAWPGQNDWYETIKINYGVDYPNGRSQHFSPIPSTWQKMTDILLFWAAKGIDGFRCDMAEMVPVEFWHYAIKTVKATYPDLCFIAEVYNPQEYRNYIHVGGFDYLYDKVGLYDTLRRCVRHECWAAEITHCWQQTDDIQSRMLHFLENHDEQRIASPFFAGCAENAIPALLVSATLDDAPLMIYAGQEIGEAADSAEGFSGLDGRTTIFDYWSVPSYRKLLQGKKALTKRESTLYNIYARVVKAVNENKALKAGLRFDLMYANYDHPDTFDASRQFAMLRSTGKQSVLVVVNFADEEREVSVNLPAHAFDCLKIKKGTVRATDLLSDEEVLLDLNPDAPVTLHLPKRGGVLLSF